MEFKFENILSEYLLRLENLKIRKEKNLISDEYFKGAISMNFYWFTEMKHYCNTKTDNVYGTKIKLEEISDEDKEKYKLKDDDYSCPLLYILKYRDEEIPVYDDDYGQQEFAVYNGKTISGGAYNFNPEMEFCYEVDRILEEKYLAEPTPEKELKKHTFFSELMEQYESEEKDSEITDSDKKTI